jgi:hypothetical protein
VARRCLRKTKPASFKNKQNTLIKTNMKNILLIQSSPRGRIVSRKVAHSVVNDLQARYPGAKVVIRDVAENPPPHAGRVYASPKQSPWSARHQDFHLTLYPSTHGSGLAGKSFWLVSAVRSELPEGLLGQ